MIKNNDKQTNAGISGITGITGIVGCGWLGLALAKTLLKQGHQLVATSAQAENVSNLRAAGINAHTLVLPGVSGSDDDKALLANPVFATQQLVICIPPRLKQGLSDYPEKIKCLVAAAEQAKVKRLILLSSSAVYNGLSGKVDEKSRLDFSAPKVSTLHQAEQAVLNFSGQACILRLTGLVGPGRHPGRFLAGKTGLKQAQDPVNLIHQQDAVGLISALLASTEAVGIFNAVSLTSISRQSFYTRAAEALDLAVPGFSSSDGAPAGKLIDGAKARQQLQYNFVFDDLLSWLTRADHLAAT